MSYENNLTYRMEQLPHQLKCLFDDAMSHLKALDEIYGTELFDKVVVVGYLNQAGFLISAARTVYISNLDVLEHSDVEKVFSAFREYSSLVLHAISVEYFSPIVLHEAYARLENAVNCAT